MIRISQVIGEAFGVTPDHIEDHALAILRRFRSAYVPAMLDTGFWD